MPSVRAIRLLLTRPPLSASGRPQHMLRPALRRVFEDCPGHVGGLLHHGIHRLLREADLHSDQQHHRGNGLSPFARPQSAPRGARRGSRTVGFCRCAPAPQGAMCTCASAAPGAGTGMTSLPFVPNDLRVAARGLPQSIYRAARRAAPLARSIDHRSIVPRRVWQCRCRV